MPTYYPQRLTHLQTENNVFSSTVHPWNNDSPLSFFMKVSVNLSTLMIHSPFNLALRCIIVNSGYVKSAMKIGGKTMQPVF